MGAQQPKPIRVFVSYAREDEALKDELLKHLASLRRSGALAVWHDRDLNAGEPLPQIQAELERADVVLLLLSVDYLASDDLHDREMMPAIARHTARAAKVIPIFLRPISVEDDAPFADLTSLPTGRKPIATWSSRDEAWNDVVRGLRKALGLPAAEEDEKSAPPRDDASSARVEIAKSRDRMIIIVVAIVAVTTVFVRTSGAPAPYLAALTALAAIGAAGPAIRHALRSKKLAGAGAGAAVIGYGAGSSVSFTKPVAAAGTHGLAISSILKATAVSIAAAGAGLGIGLGVEAAASLVNQSQMEPVPKLKPPFDGISSLLGGDAGTDADTDTGAGTGTDAGDAISDAGPDASQSGHTYSSGSVDLSTFKKNAANAAASAKIEAITVCFRPGVKCAGRISFTPEGTVGTALITCTGPDGKADTGVTRCVLPIFKKQSIPPLAKPTTYTGVNITVSPFTK